MTTIERPGAQAQPALQSEVRIEVGVQPPQVASVRVVAADLAARADFDLDAVADLRMAVDEACATLAALAPPQSRLRCVIEVEPQRIVVTATLLAPGRAPRPISQDSFGWRVLTTLADEVEIFGGAGVPGQGIRLVKGRSEAAP